MTIYEYGNPASRRILIQPVDDHDLAENERRPSRPSQGRISD